MLTKLKGLFDQNRSQVGQTEPLLQKIKDLKDDVEKLSYEQMQKRILEMKEELKPILEKVPDEAKISVKKVDRVKGLPSYEKEIHAKLLEFLPEVYAFMNEVFKRKLGFTYHDVQLQAAIILAQGQRLIEQYTGEGKTMTFQLPLVLYALAGRGAHLVTVNDYLSRRDGEYAGHIASALGLSVGIVTSTTNYKFITDEEIQTYKGDEGAKQRGDLKVQINNMDGLNLIEVQKRDAYNCDITYGTNNEFGFDYLRDNMAWDIDSIVQRELYFCIIDEADSILIDEARTPLIISGIPSDADTEKYARFATAVSSLQEGDDYILDHKTRSVSLSESGITKVEATLEIDNLWKDYSTAYHIENALKAKAMFKRDEEYLVRNGEVLIVDEFTGRILKGRRYSEGLHQAIEAKEGVEIKQESKTFATITFQNFFRLYKVLCGGSGTVMTEAEEFFKIYGLESVPVPTNKPVIRVDHQDMIYKNQEGKFNAVVKEIKERHITGQPLLIGTTSVDKSELISRLLDKEGIKHEVLNAKYHEQEAKIIAEAGRKGAVTVATNMAGRGADIVIGGGSRGDAAWQEISAIGGLHVIGTERHEARRIDNQLRGRTGRQGEPGSSRFYVALDDQLMKILGGELMTRVMNMVGLQDDMPIEVKFISRQIETAQKRIEGMNFDARKRVVDYDDVMNQHREIFYARRRNIVLLGDQAAQKPADENRDRIAVSKEKLLAYLKNTLLAQTDQIAYKHFTKYKKVDEQNVGELLRHIFDYLPEGIIAKIEGVREGEIAGKLQDEVLKRKTEEEITKYIFELSEKSFEAKAQDYGDDVYYIAKVLSVQQMDNLWVDHLELMKDIREGINLQAYAQKDPLVEYKNEAFAVFESFIQNVDTQIARRVLRLQRVTQSPEVQKLQTNTADIDDISTGDREFIQDAEVVEQQASQSQRSTQPRVESMVKKALTERKVREASLSTNQSGATVVDTKFKNVGRNDPCPCGSGKKFKKCHGANL